MTHSPLTLYGLKLSGHSHRVELFLRLLGLPYEYLETSPASRQTDEFLAINPLGQIPVLTDGGQVVADSNAILVYLALNYDQKRRWYPTEPTVVAHIQRWLSIAAGEVRYGPATARVIQVFKRNGDLKAAQTTASRLLRFMDTHLAAQNFLAHTTPTIADLACYAYIAHAPEGEISLEPYASVRAWLGRIEALPEFIPMPGSPLPEH
ncbi:MAG: Glutathione S-transferase [candidate division WWE3 bacterium GW2011_GWA2_42_9]|nr:MAG: Glutathione S-transferase [candidate division WWE3 bacterium GW2011_GWA2_42_9]